MSSSRPTHARSIVGALAVASMVAGLVVAALTLTGPASATIADQGYVEAPYSGENNFRTFCEFSHAAYDDPIVFPGQVGASHLHFFFGNTETDAHSTPESLRAEGSSTCQGTWFNKSAYWIPGVYTADNAPIIPDRHDIYYKHMSYEPDAAVQPLPRGLKIIAGDMHGREADHESVAYWRCESWSFESGRNTNSNTIPICGVGDSLRMTVTFPSCWDGVRLDAPDHRSHMSYVEWRSGEPYCPASHPVPVPEIQLNFLWEVRDRSTAGWWVSSDRSNGQSWPGGSTLHADWMNGWHQPTMEEWTRACINEARDCANGSLGTGRYLERELQMGNRRIPTLPPDLAARGPHCNGRPVTHSGTSGDDVIVGTPGDDVIASWSGDDTINGGGGNDIVCAGPGDDTINGGAGDDELRGGGGNDTISGGGGNDWIHGGRNADRLRGGGGGDTLRGGGGNDVAAGNDGHNLLLGNKGSDRLTAGTYDEALRGGGGDDVIDGATHNDRVWGGAGTDRCGPSAYVRGCE